MVAYKGSFPGDRSLEGGDPRKNKIANGTLRFPLHHSREHRSKVVFQCMDIEPSGVHLTLKSAEEKDAAELQSSNPITVKNAEVRGMRIKPLGGERAEINLPVSFAVNDNLNYEGAELRTAGAVVAGGMQAGSGKALDMFGQMAKNTGESFLGFFLGNRSIGGQAANLASLRVAEAGLFGFPTAPGAVRAGLSVAGRVTVHQNIRNRFSGVSLRSFSFAFKFLPKSARESLEIKKIVKFFRFHAYPDQIPPQTDFGIGYEYPTLFKIQLLSGNSGAFTNVGTPIKYSYIRNVSTTYNPSAPVLHDDGSPVEVDLSISFTEYKALTRQDIRDEDNPKAYWFEGEYGMEHTGMETPNLDNLVNKGKQAWRTLKGAMSTKLGGPPR